MTMATDLARANPVPPPQPQVRPRSLREWFKDRIWPERPKPAPRELNGRNLALAFHEAMHYMAAGNLGTGRFDMEHGAAVEMALLEILRDYRNHRAQTIPELRLGSALDYVARTYLQA